MKEMVASLGGLCGEQWLRAAGRISTFRRLHRLASRAQGSMQRAGVGWAGGRCDERARTWEAVRDGLQRAAEEKKQRQISAGKETHACMLMLPGPAAGDGRRQRRLLPAACRSPPTCRSAPIPAGSSSSPEPSRPLRCCPRPAYLQRSFEEAAALVGGRAWGPECELTCRIRARLTTRNAIPAREKTRFLSAVYRPAVRKGSPRHEPWGYRRSQPNRTPPIPRPTKESKPRKN